MSDQARARAKDIAAGIAFEREGIDGWWTDAHTCLAYGCCGCGKDIDRAELARLIEVALLGFAEARIRELEQESELLRGALDAQDRREAAAGVVCGILREEHGCDWPDAVAEALVAARARIRELEAELASRVIR